MREDALLSDALTPQSQEFHGKRTQLVTGATGFLGRHVVRELLRHSDANIICLVRSDSDAEAIKHLAESLAQVHVDLAEQGDRVAIVRGSIDRPFFGIKAPEYERIAQSTGEIYHCAAMVNWTRGYRQLRNTNVLGALEAVRLACTGPLKRIYFTSSIAVCFADHGPEQVVEATDMLPYAESMPLGYAQSKCVAENLLRRASSRGVPVSVIRPALISGDSHTGVGNNDDLMAAIFTGCVTSQSASDCDWQLDCVPVDYVARVLARLGESKQRPEWEVLNLFNEQGRHWREIVLWMNLRGYRVSLVPHAEWLRRAFGQENTPRALQSCKRFFGAVSDHVLEKAPYETYLERAQGRVTNNATQKLLAAHDLTIPPLDTQLLERYFDHYAATGVLPRSGLKGRSSAAHRDSRAILQQAISENLAKQELELVDIQEKPFISKNGIFNEISAARVGSYIGIRRYDVEVKSRGHANTHTLKVLLKSKPSDELMEDLFAEVAALCDPELGACCEQFKKDLGLTGCHERELEIFELDNKALRDCMPAVFGTHRDIDNGIWSVAMEYVVDAEKLDTASTRWRPNEISSILNALANMHAVWYGKHQQAMDALQLCPPPETSRMIEMTPLWKALANYSGPVFSACVGQAVTPLQQNFIAELDTWWPALQSMPQALIHNDCNPRNLIIRQTSTGLVPNLIDWELATTHVPQHDVAELLCFVMPENCNQSMLNGFLEQHRLELQKKAQTYIDPHDYFAGFVLSLRYLLLSRLPQYTLIHRFRRQTFLPRVIRNWWKLNQYCETLARGTFGGTLKEAGGYK